MNRLIFTTLCALAIVGCSGKQQKLEECMGEAEQKYNDAAVTGGFEAMGCLKPGALYEMCKDAAAAKRLKLEAEDRCVKLYK